MMLAGMQHLKELVKRSEIFASLRPPKHCFESPRLARKNGPWIPFTNHQAGNRIAALAVGYDWCRIAINSRLSLKHINFSIDGGDLGFELIELRVFFSREISALPLGLAEHLFSQVQKVCSFFT